eukprot:CCRYP_008443-RA/>CCRYP_008443-RA protein AED:0.06 eAED:0.06 QI:0/0.93/0.88/1/1/1/17/370/2761
MTRTFPTASSRPSRLTPPTPTKPSLLTLLLFLVQTPRQLHAFLDTPLPADSIARNSYIDPALGSTASIEFVPASELVPPAFLLDNAIDDDNNATTTPTTALANLATLTALTSPWTETKIDLRSGRAAKIDLNLPLFPGAKNGLLSRVLVNDQDWDDDEDVTPIEDDDAVDASTLVDWAISGLQHHLQQNDVASSLALDVSELFAPHTVRYAVHGSSSSSSSSSSNNNNNKLIQLHLGRTHRSIPVRNSRAFATIKNGNWIHFGVEKWGDVLDEWGMELNVVPTLTVEEARVRLSRWAEEELAVEEKGEDVFPSVVVGGDVDGGENRSEVPRDRRVVRRNLWKEHEKRAQRQEVELEMEILDLCEPRLEILTLDNNYDGDGANDNREAQDESTNNNHNHNNNHNSNNNNSNNNSNSNNNNNKRYLKRKKKPFVRTNKHNNNNNNKETTQDAPTFPIGNGYKHALIWRICPKFKNQKQEIMEGLVDAHTGDIYSFVDTVDYYMGVGSVYPVSNDGQVPDGVLNSGWPMPYLHVKDAALDGGSGSGSGSSVGEVVVSETGGHYWSVGNKTVSLRGEYVATVDVCGNAEMTIHGDFDWGGVNGTDCVTPGFGGPGNTQASRSGYYELNRIMEIARSHLPGNGWLKRQLVANMNIDDSCNAYWNGLSVNFYRSSDSCANTGEIAGVFDHEWGHGLDNNDVTPTIVEPSGEGIADIYAALRLGDSCIGRGFFYVPCTQFGDKCINDCTGVRDIDYEQHQSGKPHTLTWTNKNCGAKTNTDIDDYPWKGLVYSEAVWSLWKRDLPSFYGYDDNTALEIVMRLTFIAAGNVATWYSGNPPYGGCGGDSGYISYLLADDDDGDITNGTPHMQAIFAAHNRQEIACDTPTVQDSGCSGTPQEAPEVNVIPGSMENIIQWTSVNDATNYQVFRTEGVYKCAQGKVLLATLPSDTLNFTDSGLMNGREYFYIVIPKGPDDACFGPASECIQASPSQGPGYQVTCRPEFVVLNTAEERINATHSCTLFAMSNFTGTISMKCDASGMTGVVCTQPSSITFSPGDEYKHLQIFINATTTAPVGDGRLYVSATDGTTQRNTHISVVVVTPGGKQTAAYDPSLGVPACFASGSECSSGVLLDGRGDSEVNSPNVLDDCYDGLWGTYHVHPSTDKIVVRSGKLDGTGSELDISERSFVTISATVWASFATSCFADFYYTNDVSDPEWKYIGSAVTTKAKAAEVLEVDYQLPPGFKQAVRVNFRYLGSPSTCPQGGYRNYGDPDDLVFIAKESEFFIECPDSLVVVEEADAPTSITRNCTLTTSAAFAGTISFTCNATALAGVDCSAPSDMNVESGIQIYVSYIITASNSIAAGETKRIFTFAKSGAISKMSSIPMLVVSSGGPQAAMYDGQLGAPRCFAKGTECSSGRLLDGRGKVGPESNFPNTLDNCTDGNDGDYHVDEQLDKIVVRSGKIDGTGSNAAITEGERVVISATVFAYDTNDRADFWHTSDAFNRSWEYIGSVQSQLVNATEVLEVEFFLPLGANQAVRVKYDYQGNVTACPETAYGDADDLVFAVTYTPFYVTCPSEYVIFNREDTPSSREITCTLVSNSDFEGAIFMSCDASSLRGVTCTTASPIVIEPGALQTDVTIIVNVASSVIVGENGNIVVSTTTSGNITKTSSIPIRIVEGGGFQAAEYDPQLGAPRCFLTGSECSSEGLLDGRGQVGPEPNFPNTIDDCADGNSGAYHTHPSIDTITVKSKNINADMSEYEAVTVSAIVWSTFGADLHADYYYTAFPSDPNWIFIGTMTTTLEAQHETLEIDYNLPQGTLQAVRVHFRYKGQQSPCPNGSYRNYGDADDLVFAVKVSPFTFECPNNVQFNTENTPKSQDVECMLFIHSNFNGTIDLSCSSSSLKGVNCTTPSTIEILSGDPTANVTVKLDADASVTVGERGDILVAASHGTVAKTAAINLLTVGPGGNQLAMYNSSYGAPACDLSGLSCSSGDLLVGRGSVGPEPNAPNSIDECKDGNKGVHHQDESVDKIIVRSGRLDGPSNDTIREEGYITIIATVWAYSSTDTAEFWITSNPSNPSWEYVGSVNATVEDAIEVIQMETRLSKGLTQAVRVSFHYLSNASMTACPGGSWDDVDDLVFVVDPADDTPSSPTSLPTTPPTARSQSPTASPIAPSTNAPSKIPSTFPTASPMTGSASAPSVNPFTSPTTGPIGSSSNSPSKITSTTPTMSPTAGSTAPSITSPTASPILRSTNAPSKIPTASPTASPTTGNTNTPSESPFTSPTAGPIVGSSNSPSKITSTSPTTSPMAGSTNAPSDISPTAGPIVLSTNTPSKIPTASPTASPITGNTNTPSKSPSSPPTADPVMESTNVPSKHPSTPLTASPMTGSTNTPSDNQSTSPTTGPVLGTIPSISPTVSPAKDVTNAPSKTPSIAPLQSPSSSPSNSPTESPSNSPTKHASDNPTESGGENAPSTVPSAAPSLSPFPLPSSDPSSSPVSGSSNAPSNSPLAAPTSVPSSSLSLSPVAVSSPTTSPKEMPSIIINVESSFDWRIACAAISDGVTLLETARVFELSIKETIEPNLLSDQVLRYVVASEVCGIAIDTTSRRRLDDLTPVHFSMEIEDRCENCDNNATVAQNLFDHVHGVLNSAVNIGVLQTTLQTNGNAANLTVLSNLTIMSNSTVSTYTIVTNSSTISPTGFPTTPTVSPSRKPSSASWFMNFNSMKCYQDCTGDYPCGGPKEFWNDAYPTLNDCCLTNLGNSDPDLTANCLAGGT